MQEAVTYQTILREGREEGVEMGRKAGREAEARAMVMRIGSKRFGVPSEATQAMLAALPSVELIEGLTDRLLDVETWEELLTEA